MTNTKRNQRINLARLETISNGLEKLEPKPKSELTLRESISYLRDKLKNALKKGYSYQDLSAILVEQDLKISPGTLKKYLSDPSNKSSSLPQKGKKSLTVSSPSIVDDRELNSAKTENDRGELIEPENGLVSTEQAGVERLSTRVPEKIVKSKPASSKTIKDKLVGSSGLHRDLSNEFNQF